MARASFRRFDVQAKWSLLCSLAAIPPLLAVAFLEYQRFDAEMTMIPYRSAGPRHLAILAGIAAAGLLSLIGIALGLNSAGQRRNDKQKQSWLGFFVGAAALSLTIILFAAFQILGLSVAG